MIELRLKKRKRPGMSHDAWELVARGPEQEMQHRRLDEAAVVAVMRTRIRGVKPGEGLLATTLMKVARCNRYGYGTDHSVPVIVAQNERINAAIRRLVAEGELFWVEGPGGYARYFHWSQERP